MMTLKGIFVSATYPDWRPLLHHWVHHQPRDNLLANHCRLRDWLLDALHQLAPHDGHQ